MSSILDLLGGGGDSRPDSIRVTPPQAGGGGDSVSDLQAALEAIHSYVEQEDDDVNKQTALQCYAKLQSILATEQKQKESAMGTTPAHKFMARQSGGGSY